MLLAVTYRPYTALRMYYMVDQEHPEDKDSLDMQDTVDHHRNTFGSFATFRQLDTPPLRLLRDDYCGKLSIRSLFSSGP